MRNIVVFLLLFVTILHAGNIQNRMQLWYNYPASEWVEALPIGNGRIGAMIYGGVAREQIQFNEETLWTGEPHEYHNDGAVLIDTWFETWWNMKKFMKYLAGKIFEIVILGIILAGLILGLVYWLSKEVGIDIGG